MVKLKKCTVLLISLSKIKRKSNGLICNAVNNNDWVQKPNENLKLR